MLGPWIQSGQTGDGKSEHQHFRNQRTKMDWNGWILTQMTIISTTVGRNHLEEMEEPSWSTRGSKMQYLDAVSKITEWSVCFQGKPFSITVIQAYAPASNAEDAEVEWFYEDLQDLLKLTPQKDVLFVIKDWNAKVGSQETPGVNRQILPWSTEWSRAKANRVLPREHTGHSKHSLPTTQEKTLHMDITR